MIESVKALSATPAGNDNGDAPQANPGPASAPAAASTSAAPSVQSDVRLVIEKSQAQDVYVYTLIDRITGRVLTSIPRHEVQAMAASPAYEPGTVASTKA